MYLFCQHASREAGYVETFNDDQVVIPNQPSAGLVDMIASCSDSGCVTSRDGLPRLAAAAGSSHLARQGSLQKAQVSLSLSRSSKARDKSAIGKSGESAYAEINSDDTICGTSRGRLVVDYKPDSPSLEIATEYARSYAGSDREWSVNMNAKATWHPLESDQPAFESNAAILTEPEGVEAPLATKAWKTGWSPISQASEKGQVSVVKSLQRPALQRYRQRRGICVSLSQLGQRLALIDVAASDRCLSISVDAFFKPGVVELPLVLENSLQRAMLALFGQEAVAVCEHHRTRLPNLGLTT